MSDDRLRTEVYSFASFLASNIAFVVWSIWVLVPQEALKSWSITYYPDKWWAVALPVYVVACLLFVMYVYNALNMVASCPLDSVHMFRDSSTPKTKELFSTRGDIPDIQDVSPDVINRCLFGLDFCSEHEDSKTS
eukprot:TRINITY_DN36459_c0_g1_i1.p1 TRINITY_DN36459_c0_g1~~TRINITY_DN36459_c0_g1_i1.p1  ORF type:complete len:135 (+),score=19.34 TRINITY_DN36459_c0_g1_i1:34-438(+)